MYNYFEDTKENVEPPEYMTRKQLGEALKEAHTKITQLKKENNELLGRIYELEEIITGLTNE